MGEEVARLAAAALLVAALAAGCVAPEAAPRTLADGEDALAPREPVRVLGTLVSEPAIAELPDGTLFVAAYGYTGFGDATRPLLYRSSDGGATWARVDQGTPLEGAIGNSDADLAVAPDGTLYHAVMTFLPWGHAITVGASADAGATWTWSVLAAGPWVDRPWVDVAPDGTAHVVWSSPRGLHHAASRDGGATWTEGPLVHPSGGSGVLDVGPNGELAVRVFPLRGPTYAFAAFVLAFVDPSADGVAVSTDGGATWTFRELPGNRTWPDNLWANGDGTPRWSDPVAFDAEGTLHAAWGEGDAILLASSRDLGATWSARTLAVAPQGPAYFPYLEGGAAGELVATWFSGEATLLAHVARVTGAGGDAPRVLEQTFEPETDGATRGEYFQATRLADGGLATALPIATGEPATSGFAFVRIDRA